MFKTGTELRKQIKELVNNFIEINTSGLDNNSGFTTADIFRKCGLDWGNYENATSSQQQFWLVALLRELESEGKIKRNGNKLWHIK